ncbi:uncharacterized protein LOC133178048 [Saccostrea echinata]|uniref:uncharacterized protein LOC133178048 n=1 Tax=Saccostrea echinata TaxID=191078 RepID=UPI002A7FCC43|nr:uncharacterized protein LOC133178048 [Saccostrea echinata]
MTTEAASLTQGTAIDVSVCEKDSLEDLRVVKDVTEGPTYTKEHQDVAEYNLNCVNEDSPNKNKANGLCDDIYKTSQRTYSSKGSTENIDKVTPRDPSRQFSEEEKKNCFLQTNNASKLFDYKIRRRRTIDGVNAIPKASSTRDLHRQTSDFGRSFLPRPKGSTLNLSYSGESPPCVRETLTSRLRFEKGHLSHELQNCDCNNYITPTQRKEMEMKQLKKEVKQLKKDIAERVEEIDLLKKNIDKEAAEIIECKNTKIKEIREELDSMTISQTELKSSYHEALEKVSSLEETVKNLKAVIADKEQSNAEMYYEMYRKGQESAKFERNFEIERIAAISGKATSVTTRELLEKLVDTEAELAKWQSFRRQESYESAERPETEAAAILRFLKDSFYHYITDQKQSDNHLRAMIRIFNYTEPQKKRIASAIAERINKKNSL